MLNSFLAKFQTWKNELISSNLNSKREAKILILLKTELYKRSAVLHLMSPELTLEKASMIETWEREQKLEFYKEMLTLIEELEKRN